MYFYRMLIQMVAAISAGVAPLTAHVGDRLYPISYLSEETLAALDQDDASVEDWIDAVGDPALTPLDFDLDSHGQQITSYDQYDPSNLDFRIWLGWSRDGKIHLAGQFADDVYFNEFDLSRVKTFGFFDSVTIIVDGDHSGGRYLFPTPPHGEEVEGPLETNMQAQFYQAISRAPGGPLVDLPPTTDEDEWWMVQPPFSRGGGAVLGENPTFWSVEFFVTCFDRLNHLSPEDSDVSQLTEGKIIGFDIYVIDFDDDPGRAALYYLGRPIGFERDPHDASAILDGVLLGPVGETGESAVQSVSWGRIKASLGVDFRSDSYSGKD